MGGAVEPQIGHTKAKCIACKQLALIRINPTRDVIANLEA
jgi:hypothetical protein